MTFKKFLNESHYTGKEARGVDIDNDTLLKYLKGDYSDSINNFKNGRLIYRGVDKEFDKRLYKPSVGGRISANTSNFVTLLVDNLDSWKQYPKRSKSLICSTDWSISEIYGPVFIVLPKNGSKIGVCVEDDFWYSFKSIKDETVDSINKFFVLLFKRY